MSEAHTEEPLKGPAVAQAEKAAATFSHVREGIGRTIFGQREVIDQSLITLLSGGHGLLIGVPGLAKTRLVEALGVVLGLDWKRIQFTPDLMPADIIGSEVLDACHGFSCLPLHPRAGIRAIADGRRNQPRLSAHAIGAAAGNARTSCHGCGRANDLPMPFHVIATQNPLEQEGTYPLPEAQLDRFLMQIDVGYPDEEAERRMVLATTFGDEATLPTLCGPNDLMEAQKIVRRLPVGEKVVDAILKLVRSARPDETSRGDLRDFIAWGPGPRASQAFMLAARARALLDGRFAPSVEDVIALAHPVLKHRMALNFSARAEGTTITGVIDRLCQSL